ncbi:MAG: DNA cytosine methyltransferase [Phenylobacterium sp.]|nr:DNA cytosine methyltransferase [Phenylobacterium sp.]
MIYGSVCSGIEAASCAWHPLGWEAAFLSEIEPFPRAVLAHHFPEVPLHGDFTTIQAGDYRPIDVLVGGTPCQSFSIAGLRGGLDDDRGNLALEYLRLADRLRPRWLVWENVPGVLSSNGGRDFGSILGGLVELGYGFAYRVLDAQFFGVAQRRRRVFVVGHLGDWRPAAAVLLEPQGLRGDPPPSRAAGQGASADVAPGLVSSGRGDERAGETRGQDPVVAVRSISTGDVSHCLNAGGMGRIDYESETMVVEPYTLAIRGREGGATLEARQDGVSNAILTPSGGRAGIGVGAVAFAFDTQQITSATNKTRVSPELPASTLSKESRMHVATALQVRRLTPTECERLQGFPDGWTAIPYRGKPAADGPRYKALGNSMAVPVMAWIGRRIDAFERASINITQRAA